MTRIMIVFYLLSRQTHLDTLQTASDNDVCLTTHFVARMISETGANVHDVCDFSQNGTGSMKTVIHISDPVPPSHPRCVNTGL